VLAARAGAMLAGPWKKHPFFDVNFSLSHLHSDDCKLPHGASGRYLIDYRSLSRSLLGGPGGAVQPATEKARARRAFFFFYPYFQYGSFGRVYCQFWAGILAGKLFCISVCYFRQGRRGLDRISTEGRKKP
jgi:hypothetical protein